MTRIAAVHGALPPHRYPQAEITDAFAQLCLPEGADRATARPAARRRAGRRPATWRCRSTQYAELDGFGDGQRRVHRAPPCELGAEAVRGALDAAGLAPRRRRPDPLHHGHRRRRARPSTPGWPAGSGCAPTSSGCRCSAWAAWRAPPGIARLHDYLRGWPGPRGRAALGRAVLAHLAARRRLRRPTWSPAGCSATAPPPWSSSARGGPRRSGRAGPARRRHPQPAVPGHRAGHGLGHRRHRLPDRARRRRPRRGPHATSATTCDGFLAEHGLTTRRRRPPGSATPAAPRCWTPSPRRSTSPDGALDLTWRSLAEVGNLSSSSVLHVLRDTLALRPPAAGHARACYGDGPGLLLRARPAALVR